MSAGEHTANGPIVTEVLFFHEADIDIANDCNVDFVCHEGQLLIGISPHRNRLQLNAMLTRVITECHHIGLMDLDGVGQSNLIGRSPVRCESRRNQHDCRKRQLAHCQLPLAALLACYWT